MVQVYLGPKTLLETEGQLWHSLAVPEAQRPIGMLEGRARVRALGTC